MERTELELSELDNIGLDEAFQNWLSTTVDINNSNWDVLELSINNLINSVSQSTINLTRNDTSATSNISFSADFTDFMEKLINKVTDLESKLKALGG